MSQSIFDFSVKNIQGEAVSLSHYQGQVLLIVNTASKCGFTPQYTGLENLYQKHKDKGLVILGFPCNQFGAQEPGSEDEIASFCSLNFGVSFPLFAKIDVNGKQADPLYTHLKTEAPGLLGTKDVKWNFTKFLINRAGQVVKRYAPQDTPEKIEADIQALL